MRRAAASPGRRSRCSAANASGASTSRPCVRSTVASPAPSSELLEQGRLADARLAAHHQAAGRPVPRLLDERSQECPLGLAADQHPSTVHASETDLTWPNLALWPGRRRRTAAGSERPGSRLAVAAPAHHPRRQEAPHAEPTRTTPPTTETRTGPGRHIGLLLFDGVEELDAVGPWEVLAYWTQQHPEDGWTVSCVSADGADVMGAKNLVLGAHHSFDDAPALDILIHPGGMGTRRLLCDPSHLAWVRAQRERFHSWLRCAPEASSTLPPGC